MEFVKENLVKSPLNYTGGKFMSMIDFNAKNTQFPNKRITNSLQTMTWQAGYVKIGRASCRERVSSPV